MIRSSSVTVFQCHRDRRMETVLRTRIPLIMLETAEVTFCVRGVRRPLWNCLTPVPCACAFSHQEEAVTNYRRPSSRQQRSQALDLGGLPFSVAGYSVAGASGSKVWTS